MRAPVIPLLLFSIYLCLLGTHVVEQFIPRETTPGKQDLLLQDLWDPQCDYDLEPHEGSFFVLEMVV